MGRLAQRVREDDGGFTLVELIVAMVVTLVVMSSLLGVYVASLRAVTQAEQRQAATALATQVLEQLRALPYDTVTAGLRSADLAGDPHVDSATSPARFRPQGVLSGVDEELQVNAASAGQPPLDPHRRAITQEGVTYTVGTYVTKGTGAGTNQTFNLTVLVSWQSSVSDGPKIVAQRSTAFSPSGCLATSTHPFSGPCQAAFSAQAGQTAAGITVTNADDSSQPIPGLDGTKVELDLPVLTADLLLEQTTSAKSATATTQGRTVNLSGSTATSGGQVAAAAADSDPSSAAGGGTLASTPAQTSALQSITGSLGTMRVRPLSGDVGSAQATVRSTTGLSCLAADLTGTPLLTQRPCASTAVQPQNTSGTVELDLSGLGPLPVVPVSRLDAWPATARAVAAHAATPSSTMCTTTSGEGCAHAAARRDVGYAASGGLPPSIAPAGFTYSFDVSSLSETVAAESGVGASSTPQYLRTGTLRLWDGSGYSTVDLAGVSATSTLTATPAVATTTVGSDTITIEVSSQVTVNPRSTAVSGTMPCKTVTCTAQATSGSVVRATTTYTVSRNTTEVSRFVVLTDLGSLLARTSYRAAPDA